MQIIEIPPDAKAAVTAVNGEGQEVEDMPVEALLGMDMAHPNVVQTYRHTSLNTSVGLLVSSGEPTAHRSSGRSPRNIP